MAPQADAALTALRSHPSASMRSSSPTSATTRPVWVILEASFGGSRVVGMLAGDPLPRIC